MLLECRFLFRVLTRWACKIWKLLPASISIVHLSLCCLQLKLLYTLKFSWYKRNTFHSLLMHHYLREKKRKICIGCTLFCASSLTKSVFKCAWTRNSSSLKLSYFLLTNVVTQKRHHSIKKLLCFCSHCHRLRIMLRFLGKYLIDDEKTELDLFP